MPNRGTMLAFLTACEVDEQQVQTWMATWERVSTAHLRKPAGAVRVRDARPRLLGVHASLQVDSEADDLPVYVPRDIDGVTRTSLTTISLDGGLVVLAGSSVTGKTRTLFEAVRAVLPEWWIVHPEDAAALESLLQYPTLRTVLWLDDLQQHLRQHSAALTIRKVIAAGYVVVGTLSRAEYSARLTPPQPYEPDSYTADWPILSLGQVIDVPDAFTPSERQRAKELSDDPRIQIALETDDIGLTQVLAVGPELLRRWELAGDPYSKAVITAALDARQLGAQAPLSHDFLTAAAPAYLSSRERATAPSDWLELSIRYATAPVHGVSSCLIPVAAGMSQIAGYQTADYLYQQARTTRSPEVIPQEVWQALVDHHLADTTALIASAEHHERFHHAIGFYRRISHDNPDAADRLTELLAQQSRNRLDALLAEGL